MKDIMIIMAATMFILGSIFIASAGSLPKDNNGEVIPWFTPDGTRTTALTVNKTKHDLRYDTGVTIKTGTAASCQYRFMQYSSFGTRSNYNLVVLPQTNTRFVFGVSNKTPFLNLSGCTAGALEIQ